MKKKQKFTSELSIKLTKIAAQMKTQSILNKIEGFFQTFVSNITVSAEKGTLKHFEQRGSNPVVVCFVFHFGEFLRQATVSGGLLLSLTNERKPTIKLRNT